MAIERCTMLASVVAHTALHTRSGHGSGFCRGGRGAERARGCGWGQQHADKGRGSCWRTTAPHRCEHRGGCVHAERAHLALIAGEGCDCGLLIHRHRAAAGDAQQRAKHVAQQHARRRKVTVQGGQVGDRRRAQAVL